MLSQTIKEDYQYIVRNIELEKCKDKTFLITGANGFLAGYIVDFLMYMNEHILDKKCKIVALCRNRKDSQLKFKDYLNDPYFNLAIQDIGDKINIDMDIDYVFHAACRSGSHNFHTNPVDIIKTNVLGTYNLLNHCISKGIKGFLFFSSAEIYGDVSKAESYIREDEYYPLNPLDVRNSYSESKKMGEGLCHSFYKQFNVPTKIVRICHTYGPGINLNDGHVYSDFVKNILNDKDLVVKSSGQDKRAFCYISDAIISFFIVLFKGLEGQAYNMANNECFISINELAEILTQKTFSEKKLRVIHEIKSQIERSNDIKSISVDTEKIYELGWKPLVGIEEGFKRTVNSFLEGEKIDRL